MYSLPKGTTKFYKGQKKLFSQYSLTWHPTTVNSIHHSFNCDFLVVHFEIIFIHISYSLHLSFHQGKDTVTLNREKMNKCRCTASCKMIQTVGKYGQSYETLIGTVLTIWGNP